MEVYSKQFYLDFWSPVECVKYYTTFRIVKTPAGVNWKGPYILKKITYPKLVQHIFMLNF